MIFRFYICISFLTLFVSVSFGQDDTDDSQKIDSTEVDTRPLDEIFIPSDEIAADEEITFPVNI
ncbi:MAG: hypothetical protein CBC38_06500 [Gammaproteobacteria bacterium TMED78]|nr:MAG: hypothetical protein CBC38_06500 [Gammaproteobacteria bacterium TMED78]|tara:strand:- start:359 stop:550 length:192 start_codon:yes stop_codon:yes gene_type:complete